MGIAPYLVVLLACLTGVRSNIVLSQPESAVKRPGESHKLSCAVTGFSLSSSSYAMNWVKQVPGKGLEWVGVIAYNGGKRFGPGFQSRFDVSKDSSTVYLQITDLRASDTAIYYCARYSPWTHLDYWGRGTSLTVTSGVQSAPSVYIANPSCGGNSNQDEISLLCLVKDFQPEIISQTWSSNGADITAGIKKYPAVLGQNVKYTMSSVLKVPAADWNANRVYHCKAGYKPDEMVEASTQKPTEPQAPKLISLVPSPEVVYNQTQAVLGCLISGFYPDKLQVSWTKAGVEQTGVVPNSTLTTGATFETVTYLMVTVEEWTKGDVYTCEVSHAPSTFTGRISMRHREVEITSPTVSLQPPSDQEIKSKNTATLVCVITGFYPDLIHVSWAKDRSPISSNTSATLSTLEPAGTFSARHFLTLSTEEWRKGSVFTCTVSHPPSNNTTSRDVKMVQDECLDTSMSVTLSKPPFEEIWRNRTATILCEVLHADLEGVRVTWQVDGSKREDGVKTQGPERNGDKDMIFSRLTVPAAEWESGLEYLCLVEDKCLPTPEKRSIKKAPVGAKTRPQVYLLPPSPDEMETDQTATLVCLVTRFTPAEIYVAWMANDTLLKSGFTTQPVTQDSINGWNSASSRLTVPADQWNSGTTFSCVVGHESVTTNLFRSINKSHGKPTLVNVSLVLTDSFKSCL